MYITQSLKRAVQVNGKGIATIDGSRRQTWREFADRVAKLAGALQTLELSQGDRVAILALNSDRYLEAFFGVPWADGVIMPLNTRLAIPELVYRLNDSATEILLIDDVFQPMIDALRADAPILRHIVFMGRGPTPEGTYDYEEILTDADAVPDAMRGGNDLAGTFYTGGTTGLPKGVMLSHDNIMFNTLNSLGQFYKEGKSWTYLHVAPMFHLADCSTNCSVATIASTNVFIPAFTVDATLNAIQTHGVTTMVLVPTMINMLINSPEVADYDLSSLREILYGASPMPEALLRKAMMIVPGCEFTQGYGMTETSPLITLLPSRYHTFEGPLAGKTRSAGQAALGIELKVVNEEENASLIGAIGEIVTRGPHVMQGYWNKPEETAFTLRNGWMHTGDAGYLDEDGFLFIVDRVKDMIITGGENVYSVEVENAIYQHPAVAMCAVIAIPSAEWGEAVHAIVVPRVGEDVTQEEIFAHCKALIANYKCPRSVEIRDEPLPISGAGKILKMELREPYWQEPIRMVH